jgi:hypothetical protein
MSRNTARTHLPIKLRDFLDQYVEGYLFSDLRSMAAINLPVGQTAGAVGYPMVMVALAGIELLGALTSVTTFSRNAGRGYFLDFWARCYPTDHRHTLGSFVYDFARHGLAHMAIAKPLITVYKDPGAKTLHLFSESVTGPLIIHALTLQEDLEHAYRTSIEAYVGKPAGVTMQTRLNEMWDTYSKQVTPRIFELSGVPIVPQHQLISFQLTNMSTTSPSAGSFVGTPNSPSPSVTYSSQPKKKGRL